MPVMPGGNYQQRKPFMPGMPPRPQTLSASLVGTGNNRNYGQPVVNTTGGQSAPGYVGGNSRFAPGRVFSFGGAIPMIDFSGGRPAQPATYGPQPTGASVSSPLGRALGSYGQQLRLPGGALAPAYYHEQVIGGRPY